MGNSGPNRFADTARCKKDTTEVTLIFNAKQSNAVIVFTSSANPYTAGALGEGGISVDVDQVIVFLYRSEDHFWEK